MSGFIDTYFNGSWSDYRNYYSEEWQTQYKYVLKAFKKYAFNNGGGEGTTDWVESTSNQLADNWHSTTIYGAFSIIQGYGFKGYAQRVMAISDTNNSGIYSESLVTEIGKNYKFRFRARTFGTINIINYGTNIIQTISGDNSNGSRQFETNYFEATGTSIKFTIEAVGNGSFFEIDEVELIEENGKIKLVKEGPADWDKMNIIFERHTVYHSIFRNFTLSLKFKKTDNGGGLFITGEEGKYGIYAYAEIEIWERDSQTNDYLLAYEGVLDYTSGKYIEERDYVQVGIYDGSDEHKISIRDEVKYNVLSDISTDNVQVNEISGIQKEINFKPINIYNRFQGKITFPETVIDSTLETEGEDASVFKNIGSKILRDGSVTEINEIEDRLRLGELINDEDESEGYVIEIYENDLEQDVTISFSSITEIGSNAFIGRVVINNSVTAKAELTLDIIDDDENIYYQRIIATHEYTFPPLTSIGGLSSYIFDLTNFPDKVKVPSNHTMRLYVKFSLSEQINGNGYIRNDSLQEFTIIFDEILDGQAESNVNVTMPDELFTRLNQLMRSQLDTTKLFRSTLFGRTDSEFETYTSNGKYAYLGLTSGEIIRGFPDKKLTISFRDAFKAYSNAINLMMGYDRENKRMFIDNKSRGYDNSYFMFDLGEVSEMTIEPMDSAYFNEILCGWQNVSYEDVGGANEFNTYTEYALSTIVKQSLDLKNTIYADGTGMELARRKPYSGYASTDTKYDDLLYMINTDGEKAIQGGNNVSGYKGIAENYNQILSPRQNLLRHGDLLLSALYKSDIPITLSSRQKGSEMEYDDGFGGRINENDNILKYHLYRLGFSELFLPYIYKFTAPVTRSVLNVLTTNANGFLAFNFNGINYEGYINVASAVDYPADGDWEVIAKPVSTSNNKVFENNENHILENGLNRVIE